MNSKPLTLACFVCLLVAAVPVASWAIQLGQVDDFEDGTTMAWSEGFISPNPPENVRNGGPGGTTDNYLGNVSSGSVGAGGRQVMFNAVQWSGDYVSAGVGGIRMFIKNFGSSPLPMRVALEGLGTRFGSTVAVSVPNDGNWHEVSFGLAASDLSLISGLATLSDALSSVSSLRILAAGGSPRWEADIVASTLGVDDIEALASGPPVATESVSWGRLKGHYGD